MVTQFLYGDGTGELPQNTGTTYSSGHYIFAYPTNINNDSCTDLVLQNFYLTLLCQFVLIQQATG
ncbi:MAG: hypothetical protein IPF75_17015 [Bacteroidetes bacterium]|nr:hypothetical protein [Bacteroidota bacterium]